MPTFRFCECCKKYFEEELEIHQMNCTSSSDDANQRVRTKRSSSSELAQCLDQQHLEKERICEFCSERFSTDEEPNIHREVCKHEEVKCEKCTLWVRRSSMAKHMNTHPMKAYIKKCYYCDKEMEEEELKLHNSTCDFTLVRCEKCQVRIARCYMVHHLSANCIKRMIQCEYCDYDLVADTLPEHFEVCTLIPVYCENKCGKEIKRKELQHHMNEECPKKIIKCKYCAKNLKGQVMENHYSECERFPVACPKVCGRSVPRNDVERHVDEACEKTYSKCVYQAVSCSFEGFPVDLRKHIQEKTDFHAQITNNRIGDLSMIVVNQKDMITTLERSLKQTEETWQRKLKETEKRVSELEERLKKMRERKTFLTSGRFLWRIEDVPENLKVFKFNEVLRSDKFYDSEYGYNLQIQLYPNGCDYGGGHIVLDCLTFVVCICRGEYDSILEWPFQKRVTFTLIDQKDRANDIVDFIEGFEDECFQKPDRDEPNRGNGSGRFVTHDKVASGNYICDNIMFIEVKIE